MWFGLLHIQHVLMSVSPSVLHLLHFDICISAARAHFVTFFFSYISLFVSLCAVTFCTHFLTSPVTVHPSFYYSLICICHLAWHAIIPSLHQLTVWFHSGILCLYWLPLGLAFLLVLSLSGFSCACTGWDLRGTTHILL